MLGFINADFPLQVSSRRKIVNFEAASFAESLLLRSILLFEHIQYDMAEIQVCGSANIYMNDEGHRRESAFRKSAM